ncbi:MAG TPA: hypothetical protein VF636_04015 [Sphingomonas sp.]|jgi:hypothetical protein
MLLALALLASAGSLPGGDGAAARGAIQAMRLRFATEDGDDAAIARAADELRAGGLTRPVLLWAPPYPETATQIREGARDLALGLGGSDAVGDRHSTAADVTGIEWADIGFWIRPDGRTADIEVVRSSYQSG